MIKQSSGPKQKCMSTQIQSCVCERCIVIQKRMKKWKSQIKAFQQSNEYAELSGIDGQPIEFEWNIFPGFTSIEFLRKIQEDLEVRRINPEQFEGKILFISMFNDIDWTKEWICIGPHF